MLVDKPLMGTQINWAHPLSRGLIGCWLFNEGSGDKVFDLSMHGNIGTLNDMAFPPTVASGWNPARTGPALAFDGDNDYVDCGGNWDDLNALSIEVWFYATDFADATEHLIGNYDNDDDDSGFGLYWYDDFLDFAIYDTELEYTRIFFATTNTWIQFIGIAPGSGIGPLKCYINAKELTYLNQDLQKSTIANSSDNVIIGANADALSRYFEGKIETVRIYNRALSAEEILQLYYEPYAMFEPTYEEALLYSAPPVGLSIPVAMHHYAQMRA